MCGRAHVCVTGRVQGVGFRQSTAGKAAQLGLKGWVRNRSDGSVEAVFEGPKITLDAMVEWCRSGPTFADVDSIEVGWLEGQSECGRFEIRF